MKSKFDFKNIPEKYRPVPFWSWNEKLDIHETAEQIEQMKKQGIGGFFMHARGGLQTEYMGKEWFDNIEVCASECEKNGMLPWAYDENGWPSGFGNGIVNGKGVEYQQKYLRIEQGEKNTERTVCNVGGYHFYYDVNPFYVDTLDGKVVKEFIQAIYKPYYEKFGGRLEGFFTDEPQISRNGIPWSFILPDEYKKAYGKELYSVLPELFIETGDYKDTRVKFWKLITELFSRNFMKQIYDWCNMHGFKFTGHLVLEDSLLWQLTTNGACMPHYEYFTIPGMDWLGKGNHDTLIPYQVASVARQTGKKQVLSETFALCGHNVGHDELKSIFEFQMVRGINLLCQHLEGYSNRGLRKRDYPPAMYIQQPWWEEYRLFNDTVSRTGMLLSEGEDDVDVLVIHPQTTAWTLYNDDSFTRLNIKSNCGDASIERLNNDFLSLLLKLERKHIPFHLGDEIMMERHGRVEENKLVIGKMKYSKVIIPPHDILFSNTEKLLSEFEKNGGLITTAEEISENRIIDIPEITYCKRRFDGFELHYFVNSTENTYLARISRGNKRLDASTGEVYDFDGEWTFGRYESLIVIDDGGKRTKTQEKKILTPIDLSGEWEICKCSDNLVTLDYCDYYFDGKLCEKNGYILNAMYRALELKRQVDIRCDYRFLAEYIPETLYLVCETPELFEISVNGRIIDKKDCGYIADKSFRKLDISQYVSVGENVISVNVLFAQSDEVYENIEKGKQFESEKNKLTFDMELEQIYLAGDFSVKTDGEFCPLDKNAVRYNGGFVITSPRKSIELVNIERQGFPFFSGAVTVKKSFMAETTDMKFEFSKCGINAIKARINGVDIGKFMWEPYSADISEHVRVGENEIELTLINNLRNMQGPFHLEAGENVWGVGPTQFYKEPCIWMNESTDGRWNDNYCFVNVSLKNK